MTTPQDLTGQAVRVTYQEGRAGWWWAHYEDASVQPGETGIVLGRTADPHFQNYRVRLIGRGHDVTFAASELTPCAPTELTGARTSAGCGDCRNVRDNLGQINYCARCGRRFPEHVSGNVSLEEFIARESPAWADVPDPARWVRSMRGETDPQDLEAHWKAGFVRGAKFWHGRTEDATMWQAEQNECWQAAGQLWPGVRPEQLRDAREIGRAQATTDGTGGEG